MGGPCRKRVFQKALHLASTQVSEKKTPMHTYCELVLGRGKKSLMTSLNHLAQVHYACGPQIF